MAATTKQLTLIDTLMREREVSEEHQTKVYEICKMPDASSAMGGPISQLIDGLRKLPRKGASGAARPANAEPGYYIRPSDGAAIVVVENKEGTRTYGKRYTPRPGRRPEWAYERGLGISVAELKPMNAADAAALGLAHGYCIRCCAELGGDSLSAKVSALVGYGETCASREGWPYPKGVVAQRARLDAEAGL